MIICQRLGRQCQILFVIRIVSGLCHIDQFLIRTSSLLHNVGYNGLRLSAHGIELYNSSLRMLVGLFHRYRLSSYCMSSHFSLLNSLVGSSSHIFDVQSLSSHLRTGLARAYQLFHVIFNY